jgi:hypothetical protein
MKNLFLFLIIFISFIPLACNTGQPNKDEKAADVKLPEPKDPFHRLCQYWEVTDSENPTYRDVIDQQTEGGFNIPGIIFMTDSTFLENPKATMRYGKFVLNGKEIEAQFDDGKNAVYTILDTLGNTMTIRRVEKDHTTTLHVKGSGIFWPDATLNPFNKINTRWEIKPKTAENPEALKERLKECVRFYEYFFRGNAVSASNEIDFVGLPSCFKWYLGAVYVQGPKKLDGKWINCFYSEEQAMDARQMMENLITKKYNWDTVQENWMFQIADVLKQIQEKM